ncbi:hypothetical protein MMC29_000387 [Sticta canariensis]|nr:hypothetical protein [Sticta canariensis]
MDVGARSVPFDSCYWRHRLSHSKADFTAVQCLTSKASSPPPLIAQAITPAVVRAMTASLRDLTSVRPKDNSFGSDSSRPNSALSAIRPMQQRPPDRNPGRQRVKSLAVLRGDANQCPTSSGRPTTLLGRQCLAARVTHRAQAISARRRSLRSLGGLLGNHNFCAFSSDPPSPVMTSAQKMTLLTSSSTYPLKQKGLVRALVSLAGSGKLIRRLLLIAYRLLECLAQQGGPYGGSCSPHPEGPSPQRPLSQLYSARLFGIGIAAPYCQIHAPVKI